MPNPNWTDRDGDWVAVLDDDGNFKSGYLVNPSAQYEARRTAQSAQGQAVQQAADQSRLARGNAITSAANQSDANAAIVAELGLD